MINLRFARGSIPVAHAGEQLTERTEEAAKPLLEAHGIWKYFGAVTALRDVDLELWPGEVLGVVGDNGAGKSTLMKVLSGLHPPSEGQIIFDGRQVRFNSPRDARDLGIEMVYQDLALAGNMNIAENIYLGREPTRRLLGGLVSLFDHRAGREKAKQHLDNLKIHVKSVEQKVEELSGGQRQAVAIARSIAFQARIVIMDEPTAALAVKEVGKVLDLIVGLKETRHFGRDHQPPHGRHLLCLRPGNGALPRDELRRGEAGRNDAKRSHRLDHGNEGKREGAGASPCRVIPSAPSRSSKTLTPCGSGSCRSSTVTASSSS